MATIEVEEKQEVTVKVEKLICDCCGTFLNKKNAFNTYQVKIILNDLDLDGGLYTRDVFIAPDLCFSCSRVVEDFVAKIKNIKDCSEGEQ